jgi:phospholipid transport system substrate-binding protein
MKTGLASVLIGFMFTSTVLAKNVNDLQAAPDVLLKSRMGQIMTILKQKELDPNVVAAKVEKIITPMFDFNVMAKLAIKAHLKNMSTEQKTRYQTLFVKYLKKSYRSKLTLYSDEEVEYKDPLVTRPTLIQIPTEFVSKSRVIEVIYYFRKTKGLWKIYNVNIQGIGLIESYRSQFNEVIQKDGLDALLEQLESSQPKESALNSPSK